LHRRSLRSLWILPRNFALDRTPQSLFDERSGADSSAPNRTFADCRPFEQESSPSSPRSQTAGGTVGLPTIFEVRLSLLSAVRFSGRPCRASVLSASRGA